MSDKDIIAEVRTVAQQILEERGVAVRQEEILVVWASKTLQNWKAMVITKYAPDLYFEITHNGDRKQSYVDAYKKIANYCVDHEIKEIDRDRV